MQEVELQLLYSALKKYLFVVVCPVCALPFNKEVNQLEKVGRAKAFSINNKEYMIYWEGCRRKDAGV